MQSVMHVIELSTMPAGLYDWEKAPLRVPTQSVMHVLELSTMPAGLYGWEKLLYVFSQGCGN